MLESHLPIFLFQYVTHPLPCTVPHNYTKSLKAETNSHF